MSAASTYADAVAAELVLQQARAATIAGLKPPGFTSAHLTAEVTADGQLSVTSSSYVLPVVEIRAFVAWLRATFGG